MATFKCCRILNPMASKRTPPTKPERPQHSAQEKLRDIDALERRIKDLNAFDPGSINKRFTDHRVEVLQTAIDERLCRRYLAMVRTTTSATWRLPDWTAAPCIWSPTGRLTLTRLGRLDSTRLRERNDQSRYSTAPWHA